VDASEFVVVQDRAQTTYFEARDLLALEDGVESFSYRISASATVEPLTPEDWQVDVAGSASTLYLVRFEEPLRRGEPLHWEFNVHEHEPDRPGDGEIDYAEQVFGPTTVRYRVDVQFRGERPSVCWYFDQQPIELVRAGRFSDDEVLEPDSDGLVGHDFHYLSGAAGCGIAWRWGD
jgi:hypothetical protein